MPQTIATPVLPYQLVITREAWEAGLRPLLINPGGFAAGPLRWLSTEQDRRLLVERIEVSDQAPTGDHFPPLVDWAVLHVLPAGEIRGAPEAILPRLQPRASQAVAVVVVSSVGEDKVGPGWNGVVRLSEGRLVPLAGLHIIGPGMLRVEREPAVDALLDADEALRYSRLEGAVGQRVVRHLRAASVTLVGAGRNGSAVAFQFASLGIRSLRLVDGDLLGPENLDAMPGLALADVGRPKVAALAEGLLRLRPDMAVTCFDAPLTDPAVIMALRRLPADLIVTAVDNDTPRLGAALLARETLTAHLDLATSVTKDESGGMQLTGDIRMLLPGAGCVACVGGFADREETLYELLAPPGTLRRGRPRAWHEQRAGSLVTLNAIAVGIALQLWLDLLTGQLRSSYWHRLRWVPGEGLETHHGPVSAAADCPFCRPE